jgi:hypothetical protein
MNPVNDRRRFNGEGRRRHPHPHGPDPRPSHPAPVDGQRPRDLTTPQRRRWNNQVYARAKREAANAPARTKNGLRSAYQSTATPPAPSWWVGLDRDHLHTAVETREQRRRGNRDEET